MSTDHVLEDSCINLLKCLSNLILAIIAYNVFKVLRCTFNMW